MVLAAFFLFQQHNNTFFLNLTRIAVEIYNLTLAFFSDHTPETCEDRLHAREKDDMNLHCKQIEKTSLSTTCQVDAKRN